MSKFNLFFLVLFAFFSLLNESFTQSFDIDGLWKVENKEQYELWQKMPDGSSKGYSYRIKEDKQQIGEYISYKKQDGKFYYGAAVLNQNQGKEILFELIKSDSAVFHFTNKEHDFPSHIIYTKINASKIKVDVLGKDMQGFSITMNKLGSKTNIPSWYLNDIINMEGEWITDNTKHLSENEPFESYGIHWEAGIGHTNMTGWLYGITKSKNKVALWQLFHYWDNKKQAGVALQLGNENLQAIGTMFPINNNTLEVIQSIYDKEGNSYIDRHLTTFNKSSFTTSSYIINDQGNWQIQRTYTWNKKS